MNSSAWIKKTKIDPNVFNNKNKIIFRTSSSDWVGTQEPVIILFSVHSLFHHGTVGALKVNTLVRNIKENVEGNVTI